MGGSVGKEVSIGCYGGRGRGICLKLVVRGGFCRRCFFSEI